MSKFFKNKHKQKNERLSKSTLITWTGSQYLSILGLNTHHRRQNIFDAIILQHTNGNLRRTCCTDIKQNRDAIIHPICEIIMLLQRTFVGL